MGDKQTNSELNELEGETMVEFSAPTIYDPTCAVGSDKDEIKKHLYEAFKAKGLDEKSGYTALMLLLHSLAVLGTSQKADVEPLTYLVQSSIGNKPFVYSYKDLQEAIHSSPKLRSYKNPLRSLGRTFMDQYIEFWKKYQDTLPAIPRANTHGVPAGYSYLAADFIQTSKKLSEHEQAILLQCRMDATQSDEVRESDITNLKQLGRRLVK